MIATASSWNIQWWEPVLVGLGLIVPALVLARVDARRRRQRNIDRRIRDRYQVR